MKTNCIIIIAVLCAVITPLFAQVGLTKKDCILKNGSVAERSPSILDTLIYTKNDVTMFAAFIEGKCCRVCYMRASADSDQPITDAEAEKFMDDNSNGSKWRVQARSDVVVESATADKSRVAKRRKGTLTIFDPKSAPEWEKLNIEKFPQNMVGVDRSAKIVKISAAEELTKQIDDLQSLIIEPPTTLRELRSTRKAYSDFLPLLSGLPKDSDAHYAARILELNVQQMIEITDILTQTTFDEQEQVSFEEHLAVTLVRMKYLRKVLQKVVQ